jgi:hydroxymethylglutaryl-CoA reductase
MIKSYSKKSKEEKIDLLPNISKEDKKHLQDQYQERLSKLTENVVSSFSLPLSIVPNCLINGKVFQVPMVTEESSVVAACSNAFKFIYSNGGFQANILSDTKMGNIYFKHSPLLLENLKNLNPLQEPEIVALNKNMSARNAGIKNYSVIKLDNMIKVSIFFATDQSMGANYINTILEKYSEIVVKKHPEAKVIMSILSNNYELSTVESSFKIKKTELTHTDLTAEDFLSKFSQAMQIASIDPDRAMTHNKGFMNGVDAVLLATGQDYRAMNAAIHGYAAKTGIYKSLSFIEADKDYLIFKIIMPYSLGSVGGITSIHPTVKTNLKIIKDACDVATLAQVIASTGLAQNFAAVSALVSSGIQKGHMKMHLSNILAQLGATSQESLMVQEFFKNENVSFKKVNEVLIQIRSQTTTTQ